VRSIKDFIGDDVTKYQDMIFYWADIYQGKKWPLDTPAYLVNYYLDLLLKSKQRQGLEYVLFENNYLKLVIKKASDYFLVEDKILNCLDKLADYKEKQNDFELALKCRERILQFSDSIYYKRRHAKTLYRCERRTEAISEVCDILDFYEKKENYHELTVCYEMLGELFLDDQQHQLAILMYLKAYFLIKTYLDKEYYSGFELDAICCAIASYSSNYEEALKIAQINLRDSDVAANSFNKIFQLLRVAEYCVELNLQSQTSILRHLIFVV